MRIRHDDRGATGVEYAIVAFLFGITTLGAVLLLGRVMTSSYANAVENAAGSSVSASGSPSATPAGVESGDGADESGSDQSGDDSGNDSHANDSASCKSGEWYSPSAHACVSKAMCIGAQTYDESTNTCAAPTCAAGKWYNSAKGTCDAKTSCTATQTYNAADNTCTSPTCTGAQLLDSGFACIAVPSPSPSTGTMKQGRTATFDVLAGYAYASSPYSASVAVTGCTDTISKANATCDVSGSSLAVAAPSGKSGTVMVTYSVTVAYATNGTMATGTKTNVTLTVTVTNS